MTSEQPESPADASGHDRAMAPTAPDRRIATIDILRGVAILVIITGNVYHYSHPSIVDFDGYLASHDIDPATRVADRTAFAILDMLFQLTLYPFYAFLFGFGAALLMNRAADSDASFARLYLRRLLALFGIGACHVVFLWSGDILIAYAVTGLVLLPFRKRSDRSVVRWAVAFLCISAIAFTMQAVLVVAAGATSKKATSQAETVATAPTTTQHDPSATSKPATADKDIGEMIAKYIRIGDEVYGQGTYGEILPRRIKDYFIWTVMIGYFEYPMIMGMMLLGVYVGRRGILFDIEGHLGLIRKVAIWGFVIALVTCTVALVAKEAAMAYEITWPWIIYMLSRGIGAPFMTLFYLAGVVLLARSDLWLRRLRLFVNVGRMSLSNYLLQSLVCTFIFNGYGLGFYDGFEGLGLHGKIGPALGVPLGAAIFVIIQIPLSNLWMRRYRFGPVEWLWRTLTYLKPQPMRPR